jgi:lipopolysaccharide export system protein LptA
MKKLLYIALLLPLLSFGQKTTEIKVINSDFVDFNQTEVPDAVLYTGNVQAKHEGATLYCNKAYLFTKTNQIKVFGNVQIQQGDTLFLDSKYGEYNGNTRLALASGNVVMRDPQMTLTTEMIHFDRNTQQAYYNNHGTIINGENTLKSISGRYFASEKLFKFRNAVEVTNPEYVINTNYLDYYTDSGLAYLTDASTIKSEDTFIYTEKGFYDTKNNFSHLTKNSHIIYDNKRIEGDSIYYNRKTEFASATNNFKITDTINKFVAKGNYAEVYRLQDSLMLTKRALLITESEENDSLYMNAQRIIVTGKQGQRIIKAFKNARFYKTNMSGKCDSLHSNEMTGITQLIGRPVLWNGESQMTGDLMHLISNKETQKMDSLKVLNNVFLVERDTLGTGFNQVKGQNLFGRFNDGKLAEVDIIKNTEMIYYVYDSQNELYGIDKNTSSKINLTFDEESKIENITFFESPKGETYPEDKLPENVRKLRGFIWRGDERILSKEDVIPPDEEVEIEKEE